MADAVSTITQLSGKNRLLVRITNISDGTGETDVVKVDKSTFTNVNGVEPTKMNLVWAHSMVQGFTSVRLEWDHATDDVMVLFPTGIAERDFSWGGALADPQSTGTGDVLVTTAGAVSGATYDILLEFVMSGNS